MLEIRCVCSEDLAGERHFFAWREAAVKRIRVGFADKIDLRRRVFAGDAGQVVRDQHPTQEKWCIRVCGQTLIAQAEPAGSDKAARSIKVNVSLQTDRTKAARGGAAQDVVQQMSAVPPALHGWRNADRDKSQHRVC